MNLTETLAGRWNTGESVRVKQMAGAATTSGAFIRS
jgi:hypothetical protein